MADQGSVSEIPKAELHCHMDGILDARMVADLLREGQDLGLRPEQLDLPWPEHPTMEDFVRCPYHGLTAPALNPPERRLLILEWHIRRLTEQNVTYAEVMLNGLLFAYEDEGKTRELFQSFHDMAVKAAKGKVRVVFLAAIARGPREKIERQTDRIMMLHKAGLIAGVALAGDEGACAVESLTDIFERLKATGMGIEIHAGEGMGPESVWDALENGYPDRIGHGAAVFQDEKLLEEVRKRNIHIEMCPTSNVKTGSVSSIEEHPIRKANELKMNFSINTDDPGIFGCSMDSEFGLLRKTFGFTAEDFNRIHQNTLQAGMVTL